MPSSTSCTDAALLAGEIGHTAVKCKIGPHIHVPDTLHCQGPNQHGIEYI
jgi:hypothetical protein